MFGDVRALQELKNFDSQFIAGVKGVAPCTFIDKGELSEPAPYTPVPCAPRAAADGTAHARAAVFACVASTVDVNEPSEVSACKISLARALIDCAMDSSRPLS